MVFVGYDFKKINNFQILPRRDRKIPFTSSALGYSASFVEKVAEALRLFYGCPLLEGDYA